MNVLSLFDGISGGRQALDRAGIKVDKYFASEIDKYAIQVAMANYPDTIQLGTVVDVDGYALPQIDLLIGGSPCQSFSFAGKRNGMTTLCEQEILTLEHYLELKKEGFEFDGQSYLFWEFMRLLNEVKPKYFMLENVEMGEKWEKVLRHAIQVPALHINSALVSAQNRKRVYFTNIGMQPMGLFGDLESIIQQPKDKRIFLRDILEEEVDEKYFLSDKMISWLDKHAEKRNVDVKKLDGNDKTGCLTATAQTKGNLATDYIIHNTQRRSPDRPSIQKNKNAGGSGHLSREDGKTYCLDTACTMAVEIVAMRGRPNKDGINIQQLEANGTGKSNTLTSVQKDNLVLSSRIRRLTPLECKRLQTVSDDFLMPVSDTQIYRQLGNGWTIEVIAHIFSYMKF
jgi:DNA-cytosine methyltransferase